MWRVFVPAVGFPATAGAAFFVAGQCPVHAADCRRARWPAHVGVRQFGHDAIVQKVVEMLPGLAREIAQPLGKTEKMIFVSSDGSSASNLSKDIIKAAAQLPDAVESLTGLDLKKALKRLEGEPTT